MSALKLLDLPCGIEQPGGQVHRPVEIRKLKGKIQREVARLQTRKKPDAAAILDTILMPSLVTICDEKPSTIKLRRMHLADRDWLLFELRKLTWGNNVTAKHECGTCSEMMMYPDFDLDDLEVIRLDDDETPWWNGEGLVQPGELDGLSTEERQRIVCRALVIENDELGTRGVFRYGNGNDQSLISKLADRPVESVWKMMSLTCLQWTDPERDIQRPPKKGGFPDGFWEDVDMDIVGWAQIAYRDGQPGIETKIELECENGHLQEVMLNPTDFFFPEVARRS